MAYFTDFTSPCMSSYGGACTCHQHNPQRPKRHLKVLIGVTGSVATIKLTELINSLYSLPSVEEIAVVPTENAEKFFDPDEIASIGSNCDKEDVLIWRDEEEWCIWNKRGDPVLHIELGKWADALILAPLDANTMAKIATGMCDNLLTCVLRAWDLNNIRNKPVFFCPAMNTKMWDHPITSQQIQTLCSFGYVYIPPMEKTLMCGDTGVGAMASVSTIVDTFRTCINEICACDDDNSNVSNHTGRSSYGAVNYDEFCAGVRSASHHVCGTAKQSSPGSQVYEHLRSRKTSGAALPSEIASSTRSKNLSELKCNSAAVESIMGQSITRMNSTECAGNYKTGRYTSEHEILHSRKTNEGTSASKTGSNKSKNISELKDYSAAVESIMGQIITRMNSTGSAGNNKTGSYTSEHEILHTRKTNEGASASKTALNKSKNISELKNYSAAVESIPEESITEQSITRMNSTGSAGNNKTGSYTYKHDTLHSRKTSGAALPSETASNRRSKNLSELKNYSAAVESIPEESITGQSINRMNSTGSAGSNKTGSYTSEHETSASKTASSNSKNISELKNNSAAVESIPEPEESITGQSITRMNSTGSARSNKTGSYSSADAVIVSEVREEDSENIVKDSLEEDHDEDETETDDTLGKNKNKL